MRRALLFAISLGLSVWVGAAFGNQVPEPEKISAMGWNSTGSREWVLGYTLNEFAGFSARYGSVDGISGRRELIFPELDFVKAWKKPGSSTFIVFTLGYGFQRHPDGNSGAALADLEVLHETDRFYFGERFKLVRMVAQEPYNEIRFRGGYSPDGIASANWKPWLILQMEKNGALLNRLVVTPVARIRTQSFFGEFGASLTGEWMINLGFYY